MSRLTEGVLAKPTALDRRFSSGSQTWTVLTVQEIIEGEKVSQEIVIKALECDKSLKTTTGSLSWNFVIFVMIFFGFQKEKINRYKR